MILIDSSDPLKEPTLRWLSMALNRGLDLGINLKPELVEYSPAETFKDLLAIKKKIHRYCDYDIRYAGILDIKTLDASFMSAISRAGLELFSWKRRKEAAPLTATSNPIYGRSFYNKYDAKAFKYLVRGLSETQLKLVDMETCLHGARPYLHDLPRKDGLVVLDGVPSSSKLKKYIENLIEVKGYSFGIKIDVDSLLVKKGDALKWAIDLRMTMIPEIQDLSNEELLRKVLKKCNKLSKGPSCRFVLSATNKLDPDSRAKLRQADIFPIFPTRFFNHKLSIKRVRYCLASLKGGAVISLQVEGVKKKKHALTMQPIINLVSDVIDPSKYTT